MTASSASSRDRPLWNSQRQKCERFLRLSAEAGCYSAFVGFETFNPQNLLAVTKVQNLEKEHRHRNSDAAIWRNEQVPFRVELLPAGFLFTLPVHVSIVESGMAREIQASPQTFSIDPSVQKLLRRSLQLLAKG